MCTFLADFANLPDMHHVRFPDGMLSEMLFLRGTLLVLQLPKTFTRSAFRAPHIHKQEYLAAGLWF